MSVARESCVFHAFCLSYYLSLLVLSYYLVYCIGFYDQQIKLENVYVKVKVKVKIVNFVFTTGKCQNISTQEDDG